MRIGVLGIQGDYANHIHCLERLGISYLDVRTIAALQDVSGLIIPGGESTTLLKFFGYAPWFEALRRFAAAKPIFGTCAGAILMARSVKNPVQDCLDLMPIGIERNGYGRQQDSFVANITQHSLGSGPLPGVFIRAPIIRDIGPDVEVLARLAGHPVCVRYKNRLAATFHPELTEDLRIHTYFADMVGTHGMTAATDAETAGDTFS